MSASDGPIRRAMLLAAGAGSRLGELSASIPKPMLPVAGRPLIEHTVRQLARYGVRDVVINLHRNGEVIRRHFGDGAAYSLRVHYSDEPELLGTAGGVKKCESLFRGQSFLVIYGDNLTTCNFEALVASHRKHGGLATIALFWRDDVSPHSAVDIRADDRIVRFVEKPTAAEAPSHWISAGVIAFEPEVLDFIPADRPSDLGFEVFPRLLSGGLPVYGYYLTGTEGLWWIDTPEAYRRVSALWQDGAPGESGVRR